MPLPLQITYETLVTLLEASLLEDADEFGRGALARAVRVLPLACVEAGTLARANPRAALLLALCDYIYGTGPRARYCDGLPLAVSPRTAPQFDRNNVIPEAHAQHPHALETCFEQRNEWSDILPLEHDLLFWVQDLPTDLPERVLAFVARMRREHMWMRHHPQYDRFFTTCQRKGCTRPALIVPPKPKMAKAPKPSSHEYWQLCATGSATLNARRHPRNMSFCCEGCFRAVDHEFRTMVDTLADVEAAEFLPRAGRTSGAAPGTVIVGPCKTVKLYEAALLRNATLDRRISKGRSAAPPTRHYPLSEADAKVMQQQAIDAVNVDLGVLFAAAIMASHSESYRPAALPRATDWRNRINAYRSVVTRVRGIYKQYADSKGVCRGGNTRWMGRVRRACTNMFQ